MGWVLPKCVSVGLSGERSLIRISRTGVNTLIDCLRKATKERNEHMQGKLRKSNDLLSKGYYIIYAHLVQMNWAFKNA